MSDTSNWDPTGSVSAALVTAANDYGSGILSKAPALSGILSQAVPDQPSEISLVTAAAEVDVPGMLSGHLLDEVDLATAVRLTAESLGALRPMSREAASWVTTEFARALGYNVGPGRGPAAAPPPAPAAGGAAAAGGSAAGMVGGLAAGMVLGAEAANEGRGPGAAAAAEAPAAEAADGPLPSWTQAVTGEQAESRKRAAERPIPVTPPPPLAGDLPGSLPGTLPTAPEDEDDDAGAAATGPRRAKAPRMPGTFGFGGFGGRGGGGGGGTGIFSQRSTRRLVVFAVLAYLLIAAVAKLPPFGKSASSTSTTTTTSSAGTTGGAGTGTTGGGGGTTTTAAPATTTPHGTVPAATLSQLMPDQHTSSSAGSLQLSSCTPITQAPAGLNGVVKSYACESIPGLSGWEMFGYKFDNGSDYASSLDSFNFDQDYVESTATSQCPVVVGDEGLSNWQTASYPGETGQVLECLYVTKSGSTTPQPAYVWTLPSEHAFFEMVASASATGGQLAQWWRQDGQPGAP